MSYAKVEFDHRLGDEEQVGVFEAVRMFFKRWQADARLWRELESLSHRELADIGITPADFRSIVRRTYRGRTVDQGPGL